MPDNVQQLIDLAAFVQEVNVIKLDCYEKMADMVRSSDRACKIAAGGHKTLGDALWHALATSEQEIKDLAAVLMRKHAG